MTAVKDLFQDMLYAIPKIGITDIIDIILVAIVFYLVLCNVKSSSAAKIGKAIVLLLIVTWLTEVLNLSVLNWILDKILELGVIALVIVFQPELRSALEKLGGKFKIDLFNQSTSEAAEMSMITSAVNACEYMSKRHIGALIAFEKNISLEDVIRSGTSIDAKVTEQLLESLFFPNSRLHDGAVVIRSGRVAAAACILPLSGQTLPGGTRHRAGVGMTENTDAVVVIVSEETGTISVAVDGVLKRGMSRQSLEKMLAANFVPTEAPKKNTILDPLKGYFAKGNDK